MSVGDNLRDATVRHPVPICETPEGTLMVETPVGGGVKLFMHTGSPHALSVGPIFLPPESLEPLVAWLIRAVEPPGSGRRRVAWDAVQRAVGNFGIFGPDPVAVRVALQNAVVVELQEFKP